MANGSNSVPIATSRGHHISREDVSRQAQSGVVASGEDTPSGLPQTSDHMNKYYSGPLDLKRLRFDDKRKPLPPGFYYGPKTFKNIHTGEVLVEEPSGTFAIALVDERALFGDTARGSAAGRTLLFYNGNTRRQSRNPLDHFDFRKYGDTDARGLSHNLVLASGWRLDECKNLYVDWIHKHVFSSLRVWSAAHGYESMPLRTSPDWEAFYAMPEGLVEECELVDHRPFHKGRVIRYFVNLATNVVTHHIPLSYWDDSKDYYCSGQDSQNSLPFGVERRKADDTNAPGVYFVDHRRGPVSTWDRPSLLAPNFASMKYDFDIESADSKDVELVVAWANLLDIDLQRPKAAHWNPTPDDVLEELAAPDTKYVMKYLYQLSTRFPRKKTMKGDTSVPQSALSQMRTTIERIKAAHDPWAVSNNFVPTLIIVPLSPLGHSLEIRDALDWQRALGWGGLEDVGKDYLVREQYPLVIADLRIAKGARIVQDEDFKNALQTVLMLRVLFHISTSAIAAMLRFCLSDQSESGLVTPAATRYSEFCALNLLSSTHLCVVSRSTHFDFAGSNAVNALDERPMANEPVVMIVIHRTDDTTEHTRNSELVRDILREHARQVAHPWASTASWRHKTFLVARSWLRVHWKRHNNDSFNSRVADQSHQKSYSTDEDDHSTWDGLARSILDLRSAGLNIRGWIAGMECKTNHWVDPEDWEHDESSDDHRLERSFWQEWEAAIEEASLLREALDAQYASINIRETREGIRLTRKSLHDAHVVGRITQLAFIFLPLTFITGVFGMNIEPFSGEKGASMFQFWITTCCILVPFWAIGTMTVWDDVENKYGVLQAQSAKGAQRSSSTDMHESAISAGHIKETRWYLEYPFIASVYHTGQAVRWVVRLPALLLHWYRKRAEAVAMKREEKRKPMRKKAPGKHSDGSQNQGASDVENQIGTNQDRRTQPASDSTVTPGADTDANSRPQ